MKIVKFIIPFIIIICICGCTNSATNSEPPIIINMPTDDTVNGYRVSAPQDTQSSTVQNSGEQISAPSQNSYTSSVPDGATYYCASVSGSKFHIPTCGSAKNIKAENLITSPERQHFIDKGYGPCSRCNP